MTGDIPEIPMTFPDCKARTETKKGLAKVMKVTVKHINRLKLCDKPLQSVMKRAEKAEKAAEHREKCVKHAKMVTERLISSKKAAKACEISERQMARYVAKVLKGLPMNCNIPPGKVT